jgi:hypothetical protein
MFRVLRIEVDTGKCLALYKSFTGMISLEVRMLSESYCSA